MPCFWSTRGKGVLDQTRRHAIIASLLGIRHAVLAVNKIDLVGFDRAVYDRIAASFIEFATQLGYKDIKAIPMFDFSGDNFLLARHAHNLVFRMSSARTPGSGRCRG